jgi:hypothetical protein
MAISGTARKAISEAVPRIQPEVLKKASGKKPAKKVVRKGANVGKEPAQKARPVTTNVRKVRLVSAKEAGNVIDQTRIAFSTSAIGTVVGIILGASIPLTTYMLAHYEMKEIWSIYTFLVIGGLIFSAKNVYQWGKSAFRDAWKAFGFVALVEGTMVFSKIEWLGYMGLGILIAINAIASGANLVIKPAKVKQSWER